MLERDGGQRDIHGELRLHPMPEIGPGGAHGKLAMRGEKGALFGGGGLGAAGARTGPRLARASTAALILSHMRVERGGDVARLRACSGRPATAGHPRQRLWRRAPARARALPAPGRRRASRGRSRLAGAALPDRRKLLFQRGAAEFVEHQQVGPLAVIRAADQRDLALPGGDARERDAHGIDAGGFLAHEGARGAGDAVHDRDIAGEQIGELRQEQRGAQVAHQPLVEKGGRIGGAAACRSGSRRRPRGRARRRRRRRSCPCATSMSALPFTPARSSASPAA